MAGPRRTQPKGGQGALPVDDYRHPEATRPNNPPAALAAEGRTPSVPRTIYAYSPRRPPALRSDPSGKADALPPLLDKATREPLTREEAAMLAEALRRHEPWLEWAGKRETPAFAVDPVALHIHERVSTQAILRTAARQDVTRDLFADPKLSYAQAVKFYQHDVDWSNRLILGDSLQVMASLAQRENLAGKVQMIYLDPPYGIRFRSNFQSKTDEQNVKDRAADLTREPEMIRAYRDTWQLGVHSYLQYLRDRLVVARTMLTGSGSIFVQISDENLHRVRALLDEVFGAENYAGLISYSATTGQTSARLAQITDYVLWYSRDREKLRFNQPYELGPAIDDPEERYVCVETADGEIVDLSRAQKLGDQPKPTGRILKLENLSSQTGNEASRKPFSAFGSSFSPGGQRGWSTSVEEGLPRALRAGMLHRQGDTLWWKSYRDQGRLRDLNSLWLDTRENAFGDGKRYVVQTSRKVIARCLLMTTDPGDLVLDPTCGGGTTALVAEQWGRRWITIDTSRVALAIARQALLTARFEHYRLKNEMKGVAGGFVCKAVPHVTLRSIAQNSALDPIAEKHDAVLDDCLQALNSNLAGIPAETRSHLLGKLLAKQNREGKRAVSEADRRRWDLPKIDQCFEHWSVPFDTDTDYPKGFAAAINAYRSAWRAKQADIAVAIAAAAENADLVDQPEVLRGITRVAGPFSVEAVQPAETSLDDATHASPIDGAPQQLGDTFVADTPTADAADPQNAEAYLDQMLRLLRMDGVRFLDNRVMSFSRLEPLGARSQAIHAEGRWTPPGETDLDPEGAATVAAAFGPQYGPVTAKQVEQLIRAASRRGYDDLVVAGFAFDGAAQAVIEDADNPNLRVHMAHIRPDVNPGMSGLLKDTPAAQLFTVFGKPRSKLDPLPNDEFRVIMEGVDIYDPVSGTIACSRADKVAAWFIDTDYDSRTFCITQAFFPDKDAWAKLAAALKGVLDEDAFAALSGTVSLPFLKGEHGCVAVKVIDPRGNEVMRLHRLEG
jgi:adenine-specific DNA-methyltransferase